MNIICIKIAILLVALNTYVECRGTKYDLKKTSQLFEKFQKDFNKIYSCPEETQHRYKIFELNLIEYNKINSKRDSIPVYINRYSDMTVDEILQNCTGNQ